MRQAPTTTAAQLRRFGVDGGAHTQATALERLLELYRQLELDAVLCVGDVVDGPGDTMRCIELLRAHQSGLLKPSRTMPASPRRKNAAMKGRLSLRSVVVVPSGPRVRVVVVL